MDSIHSEVESFCISIDTLQQHGGDSFLATTQSVGFIVGSTLEMLSSNNDDEGSHKEVLDQASREQHILEESNDCEGNTSEYYQSRDAIIVIAFFIHAIGFPES